MSLIRTLSSNVHLAMPSVISPFLLNASPGSIFAACNRVLFSAYIWIFKLPEKWWICQLQGFHTPDWPWSFLSNSKNKLMCLHRIQIRFQSTNKHTSIGVPTWRTFFHFLYYLLVFLELQITPKLAHTVLKLLTYQNLKWYSHRPILIDAEMDVTRRISVLDTSISA